MNSPKCTEYDYINFLVAAQQVFGAVEGACSHPESERRQAHDAYTRLLQRPPPDSEALWVEVKGCIVNGIWWNVLSTKSSIFGISSPVLRNWTILISAFCISSALIWLR